MNILKNYAKILDDSDEYNVVLKIGQGPNLKTFNAHSIILRAQSSYFHSALSREWRKEEDGKIVFEKPNVSPKIFNFILKYLYSGDTSLRINKFTYGELTDVITAADEFCLSDLVAIVEERLISSYNSWINRYFVKIYKFISTQIFCKELLEFCDQKIRERPSIFLESKDFMLVDEEMVIKFLQLEDHCIKEVEVWNLVIRWGISKSRTTTINFDENPKNWTEENFSILKDTLSKCILYIRFSLINHDEFHEDVKPYKPMFDPDHYEELLWNLIKNEQKLSEVKVEQKRSIELNRIQNILRSVKISNTPLSSKLNNSNNSNTPLSSKLNNSNNSNNLINSINSINSNNSINFDSEIIGNDHTSLISRWINETTNKSCSNFKLIMNSEVDGFNSTVFTRKCVFRSTLIILTVEGTNEILGGFSPLKWGSKGECWKGTEDSFIFSFPNGNHTNHRLSHVNSICSKKAIYRSGTCGPNFGGGDLAMGKDFSLKKDSICIQTNYKIPIRDVSDHFKVGSYEIFQVQTS